MDFGVILVHDVAGKVISRQLLLIISVQVEQLANRVQCKSSFRESIPYCEVKGLEGSLLAYKEADWKAV